MAKKAVSQSRTMWVKKGDVVGGKKVQKGYLAQYGKPEKRVSAKVRMVTELGTRTYKQGRRVNKPMAVGGGYAPGSGKGTTTTTGGTNSRPSYVGKPGTRTKNYQTGEGMTSRPRPKPGVNKWSAVDARVAAMRANAPSRTSGKAPSQSGLGSGRNMTTEAKIAAVRRGIVARKAALNAAKRRKASQAEQARLERQLQELQRQLKAL